MDTIFALASAAGKAGVSIVRLSGPDALSVSARLGAVLEAHDRKLVNLLSADNVLIDKAFALSFAPGHSFTGEQVVELHTHGSPAVVAAVLDHLTLYGLRLADPGEFTRRAMENGQLDLTQVEGLADLIDAETESQRRQAVRVFNGALGALAEDWRAKLIRAAALLEATIDFVDEDVPIDVFPEVRELILDVKSNVEREAAGVHIRERIRDGFEVALVGAPNSGKSTLLNRLAGREAAITSDIAGTTRDVIEVRMDLRGLAVTFLDTAGLRASRDAIEEIGIERGKVRAQNADVRVHLSETIISDDEQRAGLDIFVASKADIMEPGERYFGVSGLTGLGVDKLLDMIHEYLIEQTSGAGVATKTRHAVALKDAAVALDVVRAGLSDGSIPVDLLAEDLRRAIRSLDSLIGRVDVENVLGEIFSSFCIGK